MRIVMQEQVKAPLERVFQVFSDFEAAAQRVEGISRVEILTDGPVDVGTRFKETRTIFGRDSTEEMEITEFQPNRRYTVSANSCGAKFETTFHFKPVGDQTQLDMELETRAVTLFAKLMSPLSLLMTRSMKKMIQADISQLKHYCENSN